MAYEKKTVQEYIAETDDKTVEGFNDNQETRIETAFNANEITSESNERGSWFRLPNGIKVQRMSIMANATENPFVEFTGGWYRHTLNFTLPSSFANKKYSGEVTVEGTEFGGIPVIHSTANDTATIFYYRPNTTQGSWTYHLTFTGE